MTDFFRPYEGKEPYLFVSYSHRDSDRVVDTIRLIHDRRYRLWYDEGIPAGSDWPRNIAVHMQDCRTVLFFLSRTALESPNCLSEMTTAVRQGKPILLVKLEDIPEKDYPGKWRECLKNAREIRDAATAEERAKNILAHPLLTEEYLGTEEEFTADRSSTGRESYAARAVMIAASILLAVALTVVAALYFRLVTIPGAPTPSPTPTATPSPTPSPTPTPTPSPTPTPTPTPTPSPTPTPTQTPTPTPTPSPTPCPTPTPSPTPMPTVFYKQTEGELNRHIDFTDGQKQEEEGIRWVLRTEKQETEEEQEIIYRDLAAIKEIYFVGNKALLDNLDGVEILADGTVSRFTIPLAKGSVRDLNLISLMPGLQKLALIKQPIRDISDLSRIMQLQEVNLACSEISSVSGLTDMPSLQTLNLTHTLVKDLTPLRDLESLKEVIVSVDMLPVTLDPEAAYDVVLAE